MIGYNDRLLDMIHEAISDYHPELLDDDLPDAYQDSEMIDEAVEYLKKVLDTLKEG